MKALMNARVKVLAGFLLLFLAINTSTGFELDHATSMVLSYNVTGFYDVNWKDGARINNLNFTAYVFPTDVEVLSYECVNCEVVKEGSEWVVKGEWGDREFMEWKLRTIIRVRRRINKLSELPGFPYHDYPEELREYLEFGEKSNYDERICEKASEIVSGSANLVEAIQRIGAWVKNNMKYDLGYAAKSFKASDIFERAGVCDEFSTLTISMLRCVNIPARYVSGYAYTNVKNDFGAHAWAEAYVPGSGWIPLDSTYGELGWLDATHVPNYKASDQSQTKYVLTNYELIGLTLDDINSSVETSISVINVTNETSYLSAELSAHKDYYAESDNVVLKLLINNSLSELKNSYTLFSVNLVKTNETIIKDGESVEGVILKENVTKYWILRTPSEEVPKNRVVIHPLEVTGPFLDNVTSSIHVTHHATPTSYEEARKQVLLATTTVRELSYEYEYDNLTYNNRTVVSVELKNTGNTALNVTLRVRTSDGFINETTTRLLVAQQKNITLSASHGLGEKGITLSIEYANQTMREELRVLALTPPRVTWELISPQRISQDFNMTLLLINDSVIKNPRVEIKSIGFSRAVLPGNNTVSINKDYLKIGENNLTITLSYSDEYGTVFNQTKSITIIREASNPIELIIHFLTRVINDFVTWLTSITKKF